MPSVSSQSRTPEQVFAQLAATPTRLAALSAGLTPAQLRTAPTDDGDEGWSANEVLAHLRACADMWGGCILRMIGEDTPTLRAVNPRTWIKRTNYLELDFRPSLDAFAAQRAELLAALEPLPHEGWSRKAVVKGAGKPIERTVLLYAQWLAGHEQPHIKQIERIVNAMRP